jgi:hypothetical protein
VDTNVESENTNEVENGASVLSTHTPLGEETKESSNGGDQATSFSFIAGNGTKVDVHTLDDLLNATPAEREWTVEGILPDSGLAILGGRPKRGKSTLVIHLGRSVEAGEPFLQRVTSKRPIVYVNYEMGLDYFASLSQGAPVPMHFYVINRPEPRLRCDTVTSIIEAMQERGFAKGILIVDSFRGAYKLKGDQENHSGEVGTILRELQEIGDENGWLILLIHHHKKNTDKGEGADNLSGSGEFAAAADVIWTWSRPADMAKPGTLEIEGRMPPVDGLMVMLSPEECAYVGSMKESNADDEKERILVALGSDRLPPKILAERTGIPDSTVYKRLDSLKADGITDWTKGTGRGSPRFWFKITGRSDA